MGISYILSYPIYISCKIPPKKRPITFLLIVILKFCSDDSTSTFSGWFKIIHVFVRIFLQSKTFTSNDVHIFVRFIFLAGK